MAEKRPRRLVAGALPGGAKRPRPPAVADRPRQDRAVAAPAHQNDAVAAVLAIGRGMMLLPYLALSHGSVFNISAACRATRREWPADHPCLIWARLAGPDRPGAPVEECRDYLEIEGIVRAMGSGEIPIAAAHATAIFATRGHNRVETWTFTAEWTCHGGQLDLAKRALAKVKSLAKVKPLAPVRRMHEYAESAAHGGRHRTLREVFRHADGEKWAHYVCARIISAAVASGRPECVRVACAHLLANRFPYGSRPVVVAVGGVTPTGGSSCTTRRMQSTCAWRSISDAHRVLTQMVDAANRVGAPANPDFIVIRAPAPE